MIEQAEDKLVHATEVFKLRMANRIDDLRVEANLLGSSYLLKQALSEKHNHQLKDILSKVAFDMGYDHVVLMQSNGKVLVDLFKNGIAGEAFPFEDFKHQNSDNERQNATILVVKNHVYEFVMVPLDITMSNGDTHSYWLGIGSEVLDDTLQEMKKRYTLKLDILMQKQSENKKWLPLASSLKMNDKTELSILSLDQIKEINIQIKKPKLVSIDDIKYLALPVKFLTPGYGDNFQMLLMYEFSQIMFGVYQLMTLLITIFLIGLILTILCAWVLGRKIARPINYLAEAVVDVSGGDYETDINITGKDEISKLAFTFKMMIQKIKEREKTILHQSMHDLNTNLPNRVYFKHYLAKILHKKNPHTALLFIEVGRIKEINNTLGHELGILLKIQIASRLKSIKQIQMLAHFSSDEFVLLVNEYESKETLKFILKNIVNLLEQPFKISNAIVDINTYIGVCEITNKYKDPDTWLRLADHAHYIALQSDLNYYFYSEDMDKRSPEKLSLMGELITAIEENTLEIYYQPKVGLTHNHDAHAEALIRWNHPNHGYLSPEYFIPLAEQTGHVEKISKWMILSVLRDINQFQENGISIKVSINISAKDLLSKDIVKYISDQLDLSGVSPRQLILEVTEGAVMKNTEEALQTLRQLKGLGVSLSIDDFGTGYSSMAYLKQLPINEMKIDQYFVKNMAENKKDALIVRSLINLAHNLGLTITAEGVSSIEVKNLLEQYGCDFGQGYYFSQAVPIHKCIDWMNNYFKEK
jgi:diguanylate cyclase (GGDEF)-like protein